MSRERPRRTRSVGVRALDAPIDGLDRYLTQRTLEDSLLFRGWVRSEHTDGIKLAGWASSAARLDPYVRPG